MGCKLTLPKRSGVIKSTREIHNYFFPKWRYYIRTSNCILQKSNFATVVEERGWIIVCAGGLLPVMASIVQALSEFDLGILHLQLYTIPITFAITAVLQAIKL